ncbi:MAG: PAS domain S-box protein [Desulfuromonadaceae bacterium]|nr:PAS domain S-box protein [Desulfuromonadaceae bacterium]
MNFDFFQLRLIKSRVILFALVIIGVGIWALPSDAADRGPWRIIVLQSYHADFTWTDDIMKGIHKVFDNAGQKAEFYVEYMDTKRFPGQLGSKQLASIQEHLTEKYRTLQPQVIITVDDDALQFLLDRRETIFPQVPFVFCGVNNPVDEEKIVASKVVTGVMEILDRKETIDVALALHPRTKKLAIITDTTTNGIGNRLILKELAKVYEGRIQFVFLDEDGTGITVDALRSRLSKLDDDTIAYYGDFFRDKNGFLDQTTIMPILSRESRRPIYSPYSFVFGLGTVGGKLNSALFQGEKAAQMAMQILNGTPPSQIPIMRESINRFMFDFRQMERWNIPTNHLPAGSIVMYKSPSFFEEYRQLVIGTLIAFIILISVIAALIVSIYRRKQAESSLRASERRYRTLIEQMPDMIWQKDINSKYLSCNSNYAKMLGVSVETINGHLDEDFYKPELAAKYQQDDKSVVMTGQPFETDELWEESGEMRWLHTSKVPLFDEGGKIIGTIGIGRDITERKRSEVELKESEERHRAILMTALDGFWLVDASTGKLIEVNDASASMLGYTSEELLAHGIKDIDVQWSSGEINREMQKIKTTGKAFFETRHRTKSGQTIDVEISANYLPRTDQFFSFIRNITQRKQTEEVRLSLEGQLHQAQKMESVGSLAGGVAHDFNNKLCVILGCTYLASAESDPAKLRNFLEEIRKAAEQSADLTRQLLAFARRQTIAPKVLDLNETVTSMLKMLGRLIGEDIHLIWQPAPNLWLLKLDPSQVDQILANLCVNARDSISKDGKIIIETGNSIIDEEYCAKHADVLPGEYVRLIVSDNGCGMDKETLDRIFEPFFTTKETGKGTGLGLSTVFGIVKQNNGFINVYSEPSLGTTFTIYLPRDVGKTVLTQNESMATPAPRGLETILLVEDDLAIMNMASTILAKQGYSVLSANSPAEATRLAKEHGGKIQLIITDVVMPEMNGKDLAHNLQSLNPQLKCLFMSGYTADAISQHGVLDEGVNFIQKPFSLPDIATKVRQVLDGKYGSE